MVTSLLTRERFTAAQKFLESNARPLEIARFLHAFEGEPGKSIFVALHEFQNADGGFGRALEPDMRANESSALATSIAFQILRATQAYPDPGMVSAALGYLMETLEWDQAHWRIIPLTAEQSPHAPWWNQAGQEQVFDKFSLNPTAEILGYLYDYRNEVPQEAISLVTDRVMAHLSILEEIEMHELLCCVRLAQTENLPEAVREPLHRKLAQLIEVTVAFDPAEWKGYSLLPVQVLEDPASPLIAGHEEAVAENLDFEIRSQDEDGSWNPPWSWGEAYPAAWQQAEREWSGVLTLAKLIVLDRFNRIEGRS